MTFGLGFYHLWQMHRLIARNDFSIKKVYQTTAVYLGIFSLILANGVKSNMLFI